MASDFTISVLMMASGNAVTTVEASPSDDVLKIKSKVEEASGIPVRNQQLLHESAELMDTTLLEDTSVPASPEVYLINRGDAGFLSDATVACYHGENVAEAAQVGALGAVMRLVEAGADINAKFDYGYTALHHMAAVPAAQGGAYDTMKPEAAVVMMRYLCAHGADVNSGDGGGKTPLHVFGKYGGHMDQLQVLLDKRADVNQAMNYGEGWTPLWYCRNYKRPIWKEVEAALLDMGAKQEPGELG